jgi:hypothetical protein
MEDRTQPSFMFPVGILRLRLPHTKPLSLTTTLAGFVVKFDNLPEDAKNAAGDPLELLSQRRTDLVNSLLSSVPEQGIKAIEEYLPGLVGLVSLLFSSLYHSYFSSPSPLL